MKVLSWIVVIGIGVIVGYFACLGLLDYLNEPKTIDLQTFNEARKIAIDLKVQANKEWADLTVVLLGFLWAILLAQKADLIKVKIVHTTEVILFIFANVCYLLSMIANFLWKNRIVAAYWYINIPRKDIIEVPDILCKHINALSDAQFTFFVLGIISTIMLLLFARLTQES